MDGSIKAGTKVKSKADSSSKKYVKGCKLDEVKTQTEIMTKFLCLGKFHTIPICATLVKEYSFYTLITC